MFSIRERLKMRKLCLCLFVWILINTGIANAITFQFECNRRTETYEIKRSEDYVNFIGRLCHIFCNNPDDVNDMDILITSSDGRARTTVRLRLRDPRNSLLLYLTHINGSELNIESEIPYDHAEVRININSIKDSINNLSNDNFDRIRRRESARFRESLKILAFITSEAIRQQVIRDHVIRILFLNATVRWDSAMRDILTSWSQISEWMCSNPALPPPPPHWRRRTDPYCVCIPPVFTNAYMEHSNDNDRLIAILTTMLFIAMLPFGL